MLTMTWLLSVKKVADAVHIVVVIAGFLINKNLANKWQIHVGVAYLLW